MRHLSYVFRDPAVSYLRHSASPHRGPWWVADQHTSETRGPHRGAWCGIGGLAMMASTFSTHCTFHQLPTAPTRFNHIDLLLLGWFPHSLCDATLGCIVFRVCARSQQWRYTAFHCTCWLDWQLSRWAICETLQWTGHLHEPSYQGDCKTTVGPQKHQRKEIAEANHYFTLWASHKGGANPSKRDFENPNSDVIPWWQLHSRLRWSRFEADVIPPTRSWQHGNSTCATLPKQLYPQAQPKKDD